MFIAFTQTLITALICYIRKKLSELFPNKFSFPHVEVWSKSTISTVSINFIFGGPIYDSMIYSITDFASINFIYCYDNNQ